MARQGKQADTMRSLQRFGGICEPVLCAASTPPARPLCAHRLTSATALGAGTPAPSSTSVTLARQSSYSTETV